MCRWVGGGEGGDEHGKETMGKERGKRGEGHRERDIENAEMRREKM